jgi:putative acetyltransferase
MDHPAEIIEYTDAHAAAFRELNLEWLEKYNLTESHDLEVINDPRGTIIEPGGCIFLAKAGEDIIGSGALARIGETAYELAKMAVAPAWRGKGISKLLIERCLAKARELKAKKIVLFSNHQLTTAIGLYQKYGFRHVTVVDSPFETADVKMELELED